jgi:hypothetical protein
MRRDERSDTDHPELRSNAAERAERFYVDVFNRRFVTQFSKVALYYDLSRYCPRREFYSDLRCLETVLIVFRINVSFMLDRNLQTVSFSILGYFTVRVIAYFGVIL